MSFSMLTFYHLLRQVQKSDIFYIWTYLNKMIKKNHQFLDSFCFQGGTEIITVIFSVNLLL